MLYIGGIGHNGSTILDIILNNSKDSMSLGEFAGLYSKISSNQKCSCGKSIPDCDFWSKILTKNDISQNTANLHSKEKYYFDFLFRNLKAKEYVEIWDELFSNIFNYTNKNILIDSSKNISRGLALLKHSEFDVYFIHLVRDPRGFNNSKNKRRAKSGDKDKYIKDFSKWYIKNLMASVVKLISRKRYLKINYENLLLHPSNTLEEIEKFTNESFGLSKEKIKNDDYLLNQHKFAGNGISRKDKIKFQS
jgi:hypothetical protein